MKIRITPQYIKDVVEKHLEIDLTVKSRKTQYVWGRWLGFKLTRKLTKHSLEHIGSFYNVDHSTVLYGLREFDVLYNQLDFIDYKESYKELLDIFIKMYKKNDIPRHLQTIEEVRLSCEDEINKLTDKYNKDLTELRSQVNLLQTDPMFAKISKLPFNEYEDLKRRINAFFQMNGMNQQRKEARKKLLIADAV